MSVQASVPDNVAPIDMGSLRTGLFEAIDAVTAASVEHAEIAMHLRHGLAINPAGRNTIHYELITSRGLLGWSGMARCKATDAIKIPTAHGI